MDQSHQFNRLIALVIGIAGGIISILVDNQVKISTKIIDYNLAPWYSEGALSVIILPATFGAVAVIGYTVGSAKITNATNKNLPSRPIFTERVIFGAMGAVIWWVVPLAIFGISWYWLFLTSMYSGVVAGMIADIIFGSFFNTPHFIFPTSLYIGGAIGGVIFGAGIGAFLTGLVKEILGKKSTADRNHIKIGAIIGGFLGVIYSMFFVWNYIINGFMNLFD